MSERGNEQVGIGIVGCGVISDIYLKNCTTRYENVRVVGCADLVVERAQEQASKYDVKALTVDELLSHPDVELVLNLTVPAAHAEVALAAVANGKSIYNEKPLTVSAEDGRTLLEQAAAKGVRVGAAPDTFLGGGLQTVRGLLDGGAIGEPVAAAIAFYNHGMENWHRDPYFFFQPGAGPLFDMGPYYLTALMSMLGPVRRVAATARASFPERTITSAPKRGETIVVNTPTHIAAALDFQNGAIATIVTSFDLYDTDHSTLVLYGSEGTLRLPDPNRFSGPVSLLLGPEASRARDPLFQEGKAPGQPAAEPTWEDIPLTHDFTDNSRGLGVADLARAIREGGAPRANGELAYHVLDVMHATLESSERGEHIAIESTVTRPEPLPPLG